MIPKPKGCSFAPCGAPGIYEEVVSCIGLPPIRASAQPMHEDVLQPTKCALSPQGDEHK